MDKNITITKLDKALYNAVCESNLKKINQYIKQGANINAIHKDDNQYLSCSCLYRAVLNGDIENTKILIKAGADINLSAAYFDFDNGLLPLYAAINAKKNNLDLINLLLKAGANPNLSNHLNSPLINACKKKDGYEYCKALIAAGAKVNIVSSINEIPLLEAAVYGNIDIVKLLLEKGAEKNIASCFLLGDLKNIANLINNGKDENDPAFVLCKAAAKNNIKLMEKMIKYGIDVNIATDKGLYSMDNTPLKSAEDASTVAWLLKNGADPNYLSKRDYPAICKAASATKSSESLKLLLKAGADPNGTCSDTKTSALHTAVWSLFPLEKAQLLLDAGADARALNYDKRTVIHYAASNMWQIFESKISEEKILEVINLLVKKGASPTAKDIAGNTALHLAAKAGLKGIVLDKLIALGNDINCKNFFGETPLALALLNKNDLGARYLVDKGAKTYTEPHKNMPTISHSRWIPKGLNRPLVINYSFKNIPDIFNSKYDFKGETQALTNMQRELFLKAFKYFSEKFDICFVESKQSDEADLYLGRSFDLGNNYFFAKERRGEYGIINAHIVLNGYILNDSKIKYYPNYSYSKVLQGISMLLGLGFKNSESETSNYLMQNMPIGLPDNEYITQLSEQEIKALSLKYNIKNNAPIKKLKSDLQNQNKDYSKEIALHRAIESGHQTEIEKLIKEGVDVNYPFEGEYPLIASAFKADSKTLQKLINAGAEVNVVNKDGYTHLSKACYCSSMKDKVKILLKNGADPNLYGYTSIPLLNAVKEEQEDICKLLIKKGAQVNVKDVYGKSPISEASINGYINIVELLLKNGADLTLEAALLLNRQEKIKEIIESKNIQEKDLKELLDKAIEKDNLKLVINLINYGFKKKLYEILFASITAGADNITKYLLQLDINVNARNESGESLLHRAVMYNYPGELIKILLVKKANPNIKNTGNDTPIHLAVRWDNSNAIRHLIRYGADINAVNNDGSTALHILGTKNYLFKYADVLMSAGADVNIKNKKDKTILHYAIENDCGGEVVEIFKEHGGDLHLLPPKYSYIEYALIFNNKNIIPNLLNHGVKLDLMSAILLDLKSEIYNLLEEKDLDVNNIDDDDNTALHHISSKGYLDIAVKLLIKGAKINVLNKDNKTALDMAISAEQRVYDGNKSMITYLTSYGAQTGCEYRKTQEIVNGNKNNLRSNVIDMYTRKIL